MSAVGTGLMATFDENTSAGEWIGYQILAGLGRGIVTQVVRRGSNFRQHAVADI